MSRSIGENLKKSYFIFSNYLPLQIWTLKICNHDIQRLMILLTGLWGEKHHRRVIEALSAMIIGSLISALIGINVFVLTASCNFTHH